MTPILVIGPMRNIQFVIANTVHLIVMLAARTHKCEN